ncbi:MAG: response regulator [Bryobacteraceae bacterium]
MIEDRDNPSAASAGPAVQAERVPDGPGQRLQLLTSLNHEIRTPLSGVLGAIDLLLETPLSDEQREYAMMARQSASGLLDLLNDTLEYTTLASGLARLDEAEFDLRDTLQAVMAEFMVEAESRRLELQWIMDPILPRTVEADARRLAQVMRLMLRYAMRTVSGGGVSVGTRVDAGGDPGEVRLALTLQCNNGLTVDAVRGLLKEFEASRQTAIGHFHGVALDLALARRVAELMRGTLEIEDAQGEVRLTARIPAGVPGRSGQAAESLAAADGEEALLVVEDNPVSQRVLRAVLAKGDYKVDCCSDGPSALAAAGRRRYRLVLMDLFMPGMDGLETFERLRQMPGYESTPVVALTAEMSPELRQRCRERGMAAFLTKPIHAHDLLETVRRCLEAE